MLRPTYILLLLASVISTAVRAESVDVGSIATGPKPTTGPAVGPALLPVAGAAIPSFRSLARSEAAAAGLPFDLVDAVMKIESNYSPGRIGDVGEIGLMQVRPGTAAMLGYRGAPGDLSSPAVNIHYGTLYLGQAWHLTKGDVCRTLMKYRAGHGQEVMSPLSATYCARARAHLIAINSPLAALVKSSDLVAATTPEPPAQGVARGPVQVAMPTGTAPASLRHKVGAAFWSVFEARIRTANARIEAKWRRVASR